MATRNGHPQFSPAVERSIVSAREGSISALGQLLDHYREYLLKVAGGEIAADVGAKVAPSDLVQETFAQAVRGFPGFVGGSEADLRAWLRQILLNNIRDTQKHWRRAKRQVTREGSLAIPGHSNGIKVDVPALGPNGSTAMRSAEDGQRLRAALAKLSVEYRQVIELRSFQELPFEHIAQIMNRSSEASRKLWTRALDQLAELLADG